MCDCCNDMARLILGYEPVPDLEDPAAEGKHEEAEEIELTEEASVASTPAISQSNSLNDLASSAVSGPSIAASSDAVSEIGASNKSANKSGPALSLPGASSLSSVPSFATPKTKKSAFFLKYELKENIGVGSTSKCFKCVRKEDAAVFACKVIDKRSITIKYKTGLLDQFMVEVQSLGIVKGVGNIIQIEDHFETSERLYLVFEMLSGGELFDNIIAKGNLNEKEASNIMSKLAFAVMRMHDLNVIHRDLKPENLLLKDRNSDAFDFRLIDFGLSKVIADDATPSSFLGTQGYLAPEILQRLTYDKAVDIWSMGVICFALLCGCLPFDDDSSPMPSESAARKKFTLKFPKWAVSLSASAKDLLAHMLDVDPKTRFTAKQVLKHPWILGKTAQESRELLSPALLAESLAVGKANEAIKSKIANLRKQINT